MTDLERYQEFIKEHCCNCKNKTTDLCEIKIMQESENITTTKCCNYESDVIKKKNRRKR